MKHIALALLLAVTSVVTQAQDEPPDRDDITAFCGSGAVQRGLCLVGLGVIVPVATLFLVGELWDKACTTAGGEFKEDPEGSAQWGCTGAVQRVQ